jgi:hypothetical protein
MPNFTRQELYDLAWSEPMRTLAARFGMSDVGLKKHFSHMEVPVPERGYWARLNAGKAVFQTKLPPRGPGMPDTVSLGARDHRHWEYTAVLAEPEPVEPVFSEDIESVRERVAKKVGKVPMVRNLESPHPAIRKLVDSDEKRREKQRASSFLASWHAPFFDSPFEQRRLKILNSIFVALARASASPTVRDKEKARDLSVSVGHGHVQFRLDHPDAKPDRNGEWATRPGKVDRLRLSIKERQGDPVKKPWEDTSERKLEEQLTDIVVEIIVEGELSYRSQETRRYEWALERRANARVELEKRRMEEERKARERRLREAREARDALLSQAGRLQDAKAIREFVATVEAAGPHDDPSAVRKWGAWARSIADGLDPLKAMLIVDGRVEFPASDDPTDHGKEAP